MLSSRSRDPRVRDRPPRSGSLEEGASDQLLDSASCWGGQWGLMYLPVDEPVSLPLLDGPYGPVQAPRWSMRVIVWYAGGPGEIGCNSGPARHRSRSLGPGSTRAHGDGPHRGGPDWVDQDDRSHPLPRLVPRSTPGPSGIDVLPESRFHHPRHAWPLNQSHQPYSLPIRCGRGPPPALQSSSSGARRTRRTLLQRLPFLVFIPAPPSRVGSIASSLSVPLHVAQPPAHLSSLDFRGHDPSPGPSIRPWRRVVAQPSVDEGSRAGSASLPFPQAEHSSVTDPESTQKKFPCSPSCPGLRTPLPQDCLKASPRMVRMVPQVIRTVPP